MVGFLKFCAHDVVGICADSIQRQEYIETLIYHVTLGCCVFISICWCFSMRDINGCC